MNALVTGPNAETITIAVPDLADGWYDVVVCAVEHERRWRRDFRSLCDGKRTRCASTTRCLAATLERPAETEGCTWVTGQEYELFGMATDNVEVARAWFEFSPTQNPNNVIPIGNEDANNVAHDATPVAGFPGEYTALWDSSQVPDGVRLCSVLR